MHLFYQGVVSRVLVPLLSGTFWKDPPSNDDDGMKVPNPVWARMGRDLADGKKMTPSIYGRYPKTSIYMPANTRLRIGQTFFIIIRCRCLKTIFKTTSL